ncbi:MAG: filamentous hemagglutinin N-terminal domain-containing protein, partial [Waterburya sp.]
TLCFLSLSSDISLAQVTSDGTVNTQVNQNGNVAEITGGETREDNLFHSFQDFSVSTGNEAAFLNANGIANIFSRVTGGNISNIDGLISANGSANLFLINPAGIIFGENARLDVGGSFYGSSASSILFEDGEFSATDLANPPVLTINAPIGLNLRDNPGNIVNRSIAENSVGLTVGLEVLPGNNLAFIGGNINFEAGQATARGGNIQLGGLSQAGTVGINEDGSFSFPEDVALADITLSNGATVNVNGDGAGAITVNARNLTLSDKSIFNAGINSETSTLETQAGNITINAEDTVALESGSLIRNNMSEITSGNAGNIQITAKNLSLADESKLSSISEGNGNAG